MPLVTTARFSCVRPATWEQGSCTYEAAVSMKLLQVRGCGNIH